MKKLLDSLRATHRDLLYVTEDLERLRWRANGSSKPPSQAQTEKAIEAAYWRLSHAANALLPYLSALSTLEEGSR